MNTFKYSRLKTRDPDGHKYKFTALDGPSYFTYDVPVGKYNSAFTYNNQTPNSGYGKPPAAGETQMMYGHAVNMDCSQYRTRQSKLSRVLSFVASALCYLLFVVTLPVSICVCLKLTQTFERIVIFRLGRLLDIRGPGYVLVLPCIDRWIKVDLRTKAFSVPPQKAITADGATIEIGADVYFRVKDAILSVANVQDLNHSTRILCQTTLQKHIGKQNLAEIESDREGIVETLLKDVNEMSQTWGIEVGKIELSAVKVYSRPDPSFNQVNNVIKCLSSVLFPTGVSNAPVEQLQQFYQSSTEKLVYHSAMEVNVSTDPTDCKSKLSTVEDLIMLIKPHLCRDLVRDYGCVYKFIVVDDNSGASVYFLDLKNGEGYAAVGEPPGGVADVTLSLSSALIHDLLTERISAFSAYMEGQLKVVGDVRAAMKLGHLFKMINAPTV